MPSIVWSFGMYQLYMIAVLPSSEPMRAYVWPLEVSRHPPSALPLG